jgi:uncharacterized protein YjiS (DUF1127 family)
MSALAIMRHVRFARPRLSVRSLVDAAMKIDARHRSRVHLLELDDRMLRDMGLTRADVDAELRQPLL